MYVNFYYKGGGGGGGGGGEAWPPLPACPWGHPWSMVTDWYNVSVRSQIIVPKRRFSAVITPAVYVTRGARRDREDIKYQQSQSTQLYK